jgi:two-component system, NtrC family, response regulator PilR
MAAIKPIHILVLDDEPDLCTLYELVLVREGYAVQTAGSLEQARACLAQKQFDVVISDMRLPDGLGLELLRELAQARRPERCIMITAYGSADNAVEALKSGAFDYLTKPVDLKQFRAVVQSALASSQRPMALAHEAASPVPLHSGKSGKPVDNATLARIVGDSQAITQVRERIAKVARSMAPVLVLGESGTGKELVARAVHACSHRASGPFIAVNCGAIPENLLEAEFFGAKKGSYTGAAQDREGYFQAAQGGTLFLDEIGDLPLAMQSKLLRAIQERHVRPLGSTQEVHVDARIVSATHRDVARCVQEGSFRQDLYYRLNVIEIAIPPLRERRADLPLLCEVLLQRIAHEGGELVRHLSPEALQALQLQPLLGNVRELENLLHRALAMADADTPWLELDCEPSAAAFAAATSALAAALGSEPTNAAAGQIPSDLQGFLDAQERQILLKALEAADYNRTLAANRLGISLRQIRYRIERLQVPMPSSATDV